MPFITGIFGCCGDVSGCLDVVICGPCNIGRQCGAVEGMDDTMECLPCVLSMIPFCVPIMACQLRRKVADKYMIDEEGMCGSFLCSFLCTACSVCQTSRELNLRGAKTGHTCCEPNPKMNWENASCSSNPPRERVREKWWEGRGKIHTTKTIKKHQEKNNTVSGRLRTMWRNQQSYMGI